MKGRRAAGATVRARGAVKVGVGVAAVSCVVPVASALHAQAGSAIHRLLHLQPGWIAAGVAAQLGSVLAFSAAQRTLIGAARVKIALPTLAGMTLAGNAVATTMPGGAAWSGAWFFRQMRRRGADQTVATWSLVVSGALASLVLFLMLTAGAIVAGSRGAAAHLRWALVALAVLPAVLLLVRPRLRSATRHRHRRPCSGDRLENLVHRAAATVRAVRPDPGEWRRAALLMAVNWAMDAVCLAAAAAAVGGGLPLRAVLVVFCMTQVAPAFPSRPEAWGSWRPA